MEVRAARPEDARRQAELHGEIAAERRWIATEPPYDLERWTERFAAHAVDPDGVSLVVVDDDGTMVGHGGLRPGPPGVADLGMGLAAGARGRGAGGLLLDALLGAAREPAHAWHKVALEVWPDNGRAIALYGSRGFVVEGLLRDHYRRADGSLRSALVMGLAL
jgi:RimJ/RimL family protein N-acetyltransferase